MKNKLAKLKYLPNSFEIIEQGDHVICAITGKKIFLDKLVSFVAIKNGMHSEKGYLSLPSELEKYMLKNNHVKNIFQLIHNYFSNIYAKN